jgi:hypothetical protein
MCRKQLIQHVRHTRYVRHLALLLAPIVAVLLAPAPRLWIRPLSGPGWPLAGLLSVRKRCGPLVLRASARLSCCRPGMRVL